MSKYQEIDLSSVKTYSVTERESKVSIGSVATPPKAGMTVKDFLNNLPAILKAGDLKAIAAAMVRAKKNKKPIIIMLGGHVIKTGCSPILVDLAKNGFATHFASNGAAGIHDTELARFGRTSEDVGPQLEDGSFGMAHDTAKLVNEAAKSAVTDNLGFGESVGRMLLQENAPYLDRALLAQAYRMEIPYTLHVALGTDIVHQHPGASGAAIGEASLRDFRIFAHSVSHLGNGGVLLNLGSAVVMPEVFLKALSVTRNLNHPVFDFTTANFDINQHYRPTVNVVNRPVLKGGKGYSITGHHELMIPLLAAAVYEAEVESTSES
jgi:hypothetical protein